MSEDWTYVLRAAEPGDLRFIIKTWLDSYRSSKSAGLLSLTPLELKCECGAPVHYDYVSVMRVTIQNILRRPGVEVIVASNPREQPPNDLHGYIVFERKVQVPVYRPPRYQLELEDSDSPLVHYVLVKKLYRGFGIARALFIKAGIDPGAHFLYTCSTPLSVQVDKAHKIPKAEWNPLCARFAKETS